MEAQVPIPNRSTSPLLHQKETPHWWIVKVEEKKKRKTTAVEEGEEKGGK